MKRNRYIQKRSMGRVDAQIKPLKQKISITLDEDMLKELRQLAKEEDRSLSQYINHRLRQFLEDTGG